MHTFKLKKTKGGYSFIKRSGAHASPGYGRVLELGGRQHFHSRAASKIFFFFAGLTTKSFHHSHRKKWCPNVCFHTEKVRVFNLSLPVRSEQKVQPALLNRSFRELCLNGCVAKKHVSSSETARLSENAFCPKCSNQLECFHPHRAPLSHLFCSARVIREGTFVHISSETKKERKKTT